MIIASETNFTEESRLIQRRALEGDSRVVKLGDLIFFSTITGDAWMLDPADGFAACLAREFETRPIPIRETATEIVIEWDADYRIEGEAFTVVERNSGRGSTILGYPTAEIQRLGARGFPTAARRGLSELDAAKVRLQTPRNDRCPCGSGKKYKKCCLPKDEAVVRQAALALHAREFENAMVRSATMAGEFRDDSDTIEEPELSPEAAAKFEAAWERFEALPHPTTEQMDEFLEELLVLPPEATDWNDLLHRFAEQKHGDLPAVFRRISAAVPHSESTGVAFFYWAAAEEFVRIGKSELLPEVAAGFRRLDRESYDADALARLEAYLLAGGFEAETLQLAAHFLPIEREPRRRSLIFDLRVGLALRAAPDKPPAEVAQDLREGIEEEIDAELAHTAAEIACGQAPLPAWTPAQFALVKDHSTNERAWRDSLRLSANLMRVAQEGCRLEEPGCSYRALSLLLESVSGWRADRREQGKKAGDDLLDYLLPATLEQRLAWGCREFVGVNQPHARLLLDGHELLTRFAARHQLISAAAAAEMEQECLRLRRILDALV